MPGIMTDHTIFTLSKYGTRKTICCFSLQFMINSFRIPVPCFIYHGSAGWSSMCAVFPGHNHLFLKINVCNFLVKILRIKHHNSSFLIHHYKEKTDPGYMSREGRHLNTFNPAGRLCTL